MSRTQAPHGHRDHLLLYGGALVLLLIGFLLAYQFVEPAPPTRLRIATGAPENAYFQYGRRYAEILQPQGIELEVLSSAGSVENLRRLRAGEVELALVQGGIGSQDSDGLRALGSLYFEPLWVFYRQTLNLRRLADLTGHRIAVGAEGSGTRPVSLQLLADNGIDAGNAELLGQGGAEAADALAAGRIDALFLVTSPTSSLVQSLVRTPGVGLFSFTRADAYRSRHGFLSSVTLPEGVFDLAANLPDHPVRLLAPAATLVARADFHPALAALILQAATQVHGAGGLFEQPGQFPSPRFSDFPLSPDAEHFYRAGPPFLQRYLPFWAANLVDRLMVMLVPVITLMIPLGKLLPPTYRWRVRSRIYRWYDQLRELDFRAEQIGSRADAVALLEELQRIEHDVMQVSIPKSYADNQYNLRLHLRLIRERLERKLRQQEAATAP